MSFRLIGCLFVALLASGACFAQSLGSDWTRLATAANEVSVAFPSGYAADVEEKKSGQVYFVYAYENGVEFELKVFADELAPRNLQLVAYQKTPETSERKFQVDDVLGKAVIRRSDPFEASFYFASKRFYYIARVRSPKGDGEEIGRFLRAIRVKNKAIIEPTGIQDPEYPIVDLASLKSSPEILTALAAKSSGDPKVEYGLEARDLTKFPAEAGVRPAVILQRQFPKLEYKHLQGARQQGTLVVKLRMKLLASGQVGDIGVYSETNREFSQDCVDLAKKIKFIAAKKDGKPVDSYQIVTYYFVFAPFELKY